MNNCNVFTLLFLFLVYIYIIYIYILLLLNLPDVNKIYIVVISALIFMYIFDHYIFHFFSVIFSLYI